MNWWQTLIIATTPAVITATALIIQQRLNARGERQRRLADHEATEDRLRRSNAREAHVEASIATGELWNDLAPLIPFMRAHLQPGGPPRPEDELPVPREIMERIDRAIEVVLMSCSRESSAAIADLRQALVGLGAAVDSDELTVESFELAVNEVEIARSSYLSMARIELGVDQHAAPPASTRS